MTDRRLLSAVTMLVLVALLATGLVIGWRALSAPLPTRDDGTSADDGETGQECAAKLAKGDRVRTRDVAVSVFNAGNRPGLATQTLETLMGRGFVEGEAGNAPGEFGKVKFVRVLAPKRKDPAAKLVAKQFGPQTFVQVTDQDLGPGVDVIVGDGFAGFVDAPKRLKAKVAGSGC